MPSGLDNFLNFAIPFAIFFFLGFKIYVVLQDPIDKFFDWVGEKLEPTEVEGEEGSIWDAQIEFK